MWKPSVHAYTCACMYMHTCMHVHLFTCMHAHLHACICLYMHAPVHACMYAHVHACMCMCTHTCKHMCTHVCAWLCMCAHTCIYFGVLFPCDACHELTRQMLERVTQTLPQWLHPVQDLHRNPASVALLVNDIKTRREMMMQELSRCYSESLIPF